jgi:hypothetical protein
MAEFVPGAEAVPGFLFLEDAMSESEVRDGEVFSPVRRQMPVGRRFQPGNPGRPKGSRNKLGEQFLAAMCADFEKHGVRAIERVREEEPGTYLRVIARIVPPHMLQMQEESAVSALSDEELTMYLAAVREALAAREGGT